MRNKFDEQLALLNVEMVKMGSLCELAISNAVRGLLESNGEMLHLVADTDSEIDEKEREIENMCFKLLLQQQPVARDLRTISAALKMISDMERIGRPGVGYCGNSCHRQRKSGAQSHPSESHGPRQASARVTEAIKSFVNRDLTLAHKVMGDDDVVDEHFEEVKREIICLIRKEEVSAEASLDLLMIAKYLERIADHAVNVAEWVEFSITGQHMSEEIRRLK